MKNPRSQLMPNHARGALPKPAEIRAPRLDPEGFPGSHAGHPALVFFPRRGPHGFPICPRLEVGEEHLMGPGLRGQRPGPRTREVNASNGIPPILISAFGKE